jgi:hypothetical protein
MDRRAFLAMAGMVLVSAPAVALADLVIQL